MTETIRRVLARPLFVRARSAEGHVRIIRDARALSSSAALLAGYGGRPAALIQDVLSDLWALGTTALYVQLDDLKSKADLVVTPTPGHRIVVAGQNFREEAETCEPAPNGAYLVERQYRTLGPYESPPLEHALVLVRITAGSGRRYLVDVPPYASHVSIVAQQRVVAAARPIPRGGELRYHFDPTVRQE